MRVSLKSRALVIGIAAGSLLAVPMALPSGSAVAAPGKCGAIGTKAVGTKTKITVSKCTPLAATGGSGTGVTTTGKTGVLKGKSINTITWATKHGTSKMTVNYAPAKGAGKCKGVGTTRLAITGKVLSSTGPASKVIKPNQPVKASVCVTKATPTKPSVVSLEPGTVETF